MWSRARLASRSFLVAGLAALALGCSGAEAAQHSPYENCDATHHDRCTLDTSCVPANTFPETSTAAGTFCSVACTQDSDCAASLDGRPGVCVDEGDGGQCYAGCDTVTLACPAGQTCIERGSDVLPDYCAPTGTAGPAPTGTPLYGRCMAEDPCPEGTTCSLANTMPAGSTGPGALCTLECDGATPCPAAADGRAGVCVTVNELGVCYAPCAEGTMACPEGQRCATAGGASPYCLPDGA